MIMQASLERAFASALTSAILALAVAPLAQAEGGDAKAGQQFANVHCAQCHAIEPGRSSPVATAPTFEKIANMPGMNLMALDVWMRTGHPTMPLLKLDATQTEDLAAWLETLKAAR